jgi:hypothetical protein
MQATSALKLKQRRYAELTAWMRFQQATSAVFKIKQKKCTQLTNWMGFHACNISSIRNQAEEVHRTHSLDGISCKQHQHSKPSRGGAYNSHPGWDFMQATSAFKIKRRWCIQLTAWIGFHTGNISN